jgi:hypothetical protein
VNCDECKEQVLELIERETVDPQGVREMLAKCPECRAEFDEVKAQLAVASQLPLEAPPDHLDILILQAAEARTAGVAPAIDTLLAEQSAMEAAAPKAELRPRLFLWRQPLAMAAVALLVVGIGISSVWIVGGPGRKQVAEAPAIEGPTAADVHAEALEEAVGGTAAERVELAKASTDEVAARAADAEAPAARKARARSPKKKEARAAGRGTPAPVAPEEEPQRVAVAETDQAAGSAAEQYDAAELPSLKTDDSKDSLSFGQANEQQGATTEAQRKCMSTILVFEKRQKDNVNFKPTPQQTLDAGLCYQMLGKRAEAERWLKRATEHPSTKARATEALQKIQ